MQIEIGDVLGDRPGITKIESRLKWDAWKDVTERKLTKLQLIW